MITFSQTLREEHRRLVAQLSCLQTAADALGTAPLACLREKIGHAYLFILQDLLPHAQAEEQVLYPAVGRLLGAGAATETMTRDHLEVLQLTKELETLWLHLFYAPVTVADEQALRRVLYGLSAILSLHLVKEEELYLPLLETCFTLEERERLVAMMEQAVIEARDKLKRSA
jgi:iron-sulfur cluster repair protein YtfE (RIC family)